MDWKAEWVLYKKIQKWWIITGLLCVPYGVLYGELISHYAAHEKPIFWCCIAACVVTNYLIQGMPPDK